MISQQREPQSNPDELGAILSNASEITPRNLYSFSVTRPGVIGGRGGGNGESRSDKRASLKTPEFNPSWQEGAACELEDPEFFFLLKVRNLQTKAKNPLL